MAESIHVEGYVCKSSLKHDLVSVLEKAKNG